MRKKFQMILKTVMVSGLIMAMTIPSVNAVAHETVELVDTEAKVVDCDSPKTQFSVQPTNRSHFTWGVDISSGVDLTSNDMTMFSFGAAFGYRWKWLNFAGIGASIISMMNNSSRCYPVYAVVHTSFSQQPKLCFMEVRGGISVNSILDSSTKAGAYASLGLGISLARSKSFSSYVIVRGVVMPVKGTYEDETMNFSYTLGYANIGLGITF